MTREGHIEHIAWYFENNVFIYMTTKTCTKTKIKIVNQYYWHIHDKAPIGYQRVGLMTYTIMKDTDVNTYEAALWKFKLKTQIVY